MNRDRGDASTALRVRDWDDVRVLIAALDAFATDAAAQAHEEARWQDADVPQAHVGILRDWASRARRLCEQAEHALMSSSAEDE
ncbi:hypothetical protein LK09_00810 [Microbacterium mangrovi]|uniref:Uncharacterized protein n=1 Tax=Microbacterium mangrovi TaxID=1348253 RepID=A0A0B2AE49_9MICO|nr:hypothetical protein [Microbacterium mangrovi]KHK99906.1 hypothetical protein LK09_00810 [Microbacterium mangrovi]